MDKLISVVIPNYNCAPYLDKCLDSVTKQTYSNIEIVVCDNASTDDSVEILNKWAEKDDRIRVLTTEINQGGLRCYNRLFKEAKGEYIMIQDSDDWCSPERVAKQAEVLDTHEVGCCMTNSVYYYDHSEPEYPEQPGSGVVTINTYEDWAPATIMFKKAILDKIPGYNLFWDRVTSYDRYFILDIMDKFGAYYLDEYLYHVKARHDSDHRSIDLDDENALRKLISYDIYLFLKKQRKKTGTDHLNDNNIKELKKYEQKLMNNRRYIADKMRVFACIQIDHGNLKEGRKLLMNAIGIAPFYIKNYQSLFYMFKSKIRIGFASGSIMISDAFAEVECLINFDAI